MTKMRSSLVAALVAVTTTTASADPRHVLVLQSEGRADGAVRARIDAAVLKLAKSGPGEVSPGETTLSDAAAAVGCKPDTQPCKEQILDMLAVDEIVYTILTPKPGGTQIEVHRVGKGGASTEAKMLLGAGQSPDKLDGIAPMFATTGTATPPTRPIEPPTTPPTPPPTTPPTTPPGPPIGSTTGPVPADPKAAPTDPITDPAAPAGVVQPSPVPAQPSDTPNPRRQRLELAGMVGGGAFVLLGFILWGRASDLQSEIDKAPTQTKAQLVALADLESRGDAYAGWGNLLFLGGAVLGGVSTYFYIKDRRAHRHTMSARISPTVFDHGAGLAFTFGATP